MTASLIDAIVAAGRRATAEREARVPLAALTGRRRRDPGAFRNALETGPVPRIIAECKRRSPSRGVLRAAYDPAAIAASYEKAGAAAISVLTEPAFFDGALDHLRAVRAAVGAPILRKDFVVTAYQIAEAADAGADAVLLIVAALDDAALKALMRAAAEYGLDALVEAHDETEIDRALAAGARIIGVNSRNLHTLEVDPGAPAALAARIPEGVIAVAESGIRDGRAIASLGAAGYRACLIGERLMVSDDPGHALRALIAESRAA